MHTWWLLCASLWYIATNAVLAYKSFSAVPLFFAVTYSVGLFGGLGDHVEPFVPQQWHASTTQIMENYIGKFPLFMGLAGILLRFFTLKSVTGVQKLLTIMVLLFSFAVVVFDEPYDYNRDLRWHLLHCAVPHGLAFFTSLWVFQCLRKSPPKFILEDDD